MYKVLIVEDEMLVRVGLKNSISWKKYDMDVIADVTNGQAALEIYEREAPDLIVTDIKMPIMDGMELITQIRKNDNTTKFIILSCLEEFEYARKAMEHNVSGYILKLTMTFEEMDSVLSKVYEELQKQKMPDTLHVERKIELEVLKDKLLKDFMFYGIYSEVEFSKMMTNMGWKINPHGLILCTMEIGQYWKLKDKFEDERGQLLKFTILNVLNEILENHQIGEAFHDSESYYMLIFNFSGSLSLCEVRQKLKDIFENVEKVMKTYFDSPVYISASSIQEGFSKLRKMYDESMLILKDRFFLKHKIFFGFDPPLYNLKFSWKALMQEKMKYWENLSDINIFSLQMKMNSIINIDPQDERTLKQLLTQLIQWVVVTLQISSESTSTMTLETNEKIMQSENIIEAIELMGIYLQEVVKIRLNMRNVSKEVASAIEYICSNYTQDISLNEVSEFVNLSPGYLSNLFKKEMDKNLIEYLTEFRIDKAKELLLNSSMKSYEIAEKVGFSDNGYFSRTFKKITGIRPNEFRKKLIMNWSDESKNEDI